MEAFFPTSEARQSWRSSRPSTMTLLQVQQYDRRMNGLCYELSIIIDPSFKLSINLGQAKGRWLLQTLRLPGGVPASWYEHRQWPAC